MSEQPKFKVGDRLLYVGVSPRRYDAIVIGIDKERYLTEHYIIEWHKIGNDKEPPTRNSVAVSVIDSNYILYDSPEGILRRI